MLIQLAIYKIKAATLLICGILNLIFATFLWLKDHKNKISFHLGFAALFSSLYAIAYGSLYIVYFFYINSKVTTEQYIFLGRFTWIGLPLLPAYVLATYYIRGNTRNIKTKAVILYGSALLIVLLTLITPWMIVELDISYSYIDWINGPLGPVGRVYILSGLLLATYNLFKKFLVSKGLERLQLKYFSIGVFIYALSGILTTGIMPLVTGKGGATDFPCYASVIWIFLSMYAILKYHLLDIRVAITRTGIFIGIYTILLGIPFYLGYQTKQWILSAILLAVFASVGPIVYRYLQKKTEDLLFKKSRQYQKILLSASEDILTHKDSQTLVKRLSSLIFDNVAPSFVAIYLLEKESFQRKIATPDDISLPSRLEIIDPLLQNLQIKKGMLLDHILGDHFISLVLPIGHKENMKGLLLMGKKKEREIYSTEDIETFRTLLNQTSLALENIEHMREVIEEHKEKERLKKEMELAKQIQQSLLPRTSPTDLEGMKIEGLLLPAQEVAGDYFDFIPYGPGKIGIVVADVSGKGMDAGMVMSMTKSTLYTLSKQNLAPRDLVLQLNKILCEQLRQQKFISLIYAEYFSASNTFTWSGAGQENVIVYRAGEENSKPRVEVIKTGGIVLGMVPEIDHIITQQSLTLNKGDRIVLYSDGAIEARNPEDEMFSLNNLIATIEKSPVQTLENFILYIKDEIKNFIKSASQYDDITLVAMERQ